MTTHKLLQIEDVMTPRPHGVPVRESIARAVECMQALQVRHLPVFDDERLVGVVSSGRLGWRIGSVARVMEAPYLVRVGTSVADAAEAMAEDGVDAALVVDHEERVIGIFTTTDALRALAAAVRR